jgi:alpha-L-fucosidase 2
LTGLLFAPVALAGQATVKPRSAGNAGAEGAAAARPETPLRLWYDLPATNDNDGWVSQSLPLGNGYMGVNVFGGVRQERLQITENSLVDSPSDKIGGLNSFADVFLDFPHATPTHYSRDLVLNSSTAHVSYDNEGVHFTREYFTSYPDKVLVIRLQASKAGALDFTLRPTIPYLTEFRRATEGPQDHRGKHGTVSATGDTITLAGTMDYYDIKFEGQFKVIPQGGTMQATNDAHGGNGSISVKGATSAVILVAVGTNYPIANPQVFSAVAPRDKLKGFAGPHDKVSGYIAAAAVRSYADLMERHEADYTKLFDRVNFDLHAPVPAVTTDKMVDAERAGGSNPYFDELAFQFGRYLLISSSRSGALPPNLQGVWNVYQDAPWTAGYWHNVNQQMNYWLAFNTNLPELFDSYIDLYRAYLPAQQASAKEFLTRYHPAGLAADGDNGWALGNSMRPFEPAGKAAHSGFGTGPWTTMLFWDYYDFTRDKTLLRRVVYPAMLGQANFLSRFVQDIDGKLLAKPSSSPENADNLQTAGTTFDQQTIYENHRNTIAAAQILGAHDPLIAKLEAQMPKLDPILIGDSGQIKEYREETTYGSIGDPHHRHMSQLLGLYPGLLINTNTPAWLDAARVSLEGREAGNHPGWARAQRMEAWARTGDGDKAYAFYHYWMSHHAMYNLWNNHRDSRTAKLFQVDGNFGVTAGVAEMLLQSHEGFIAPLPALPHAWPNGSYRGLLARGAFEVSADWSSGHADRIAVRSKAGGLLKLHYPGIGGSTVRTKAGDTVTVRHLGNDDISAETVPGQTYVVTAIPLVEKVAPVMGLAIAADANGGLRLNWQSSAPAVSYTIDRAIGNSPTYERIAAGQTGTSFVDSTAAIAKATRARYRVSAVSVSGSESPGASVFWFRSKPTDPISRQ